MQSSIYTEDSSLDNKRKLKKFCMNEETTSSKKRNKRNYSKERERKRYSA